MIIVVVWLTRYYGWIPQYYSYRGSMVTTLLWLPRYFFTAVLRRPRYYGNRGTIITAVLWLFTGELMILG